MAYNFGQTQETQHNMRGYYFPRSQKGGEGINETAQIHHATITVAKDGTGDYESIEEAIKEANQNHWEEGFHIHIKKGTYQIKKEIPILKRGILITGAGFETVIISPENKAALVLFTERATFEKLTFSNSHEGIRTEGDFDNNKIQDCNFLDCQTAIRMLGTQNSKIINCYYFGFNLDSPRTFIRAEGLLNRLNIHYNKSEFCEIFFETTEGRNNLSSIVGNELGGDITAKLFRCSITGNVGNGDKIHLLDLDDNDNGNNVVNGNMAEEIIIDSDRNIITSNIILDRIEDNGTQNKKDNNIKEEL